MDIKKLQDELNNRPIPEFLGLSPEQMQLIFYHPFGDMKSIVKLNSTFNKELIVDVPVLSRASLLIKRIGEAGVLKATQKGFLPIKLVRELDDFEARHGFKQNAQSEEYVEDILCLRLVLTDIGWIKKRNSKFSLTKKGLRIYENGIDVASYLELLEFWLFKCNWSYFERGAMFLSLQQSIVFLLYSLKQKADEFISLENYTNYFIKAFPFCLEEEPEEMYCRTPEENLRRTIGRRIIEDFAAYFGLVEFLTDENSAKQIFKVKSKFRTTQLFKEVFNWFPPEESNIVVPDGEKVH